MVGWEKKDHLKIGSYTFLFKVRDLELLWVVEIGFHCLVESRHRSQMWGFFMLFIIYYILYSISIPNARVLIRVICARWNTNMKTVRFPATKHFASAAPNLGDRVYMCYFTDMYVDLLISNAHLTDTVKTPQERLTNSWEEEAVTAADQIVRTWCLSGPDSGRGCWWKDLSLTQRCSVCSQMNSQDCFRSH